MIELECTHQGNEVFSSQLLITLQRSAKLGRNLVAKQLQGTVIHNQRICLIKFGEAELTGSNPDFGFEHGGQSDGETPEPFPNSEDKPVRV